MMDEGEVAEIVATLATNAIDYTHAGWTFTGLDIGEIEVTNPYGERFRLTVERIYGEET